MLVIRPFWEETLKFSWETTAVGESQIRIVSLMMVLKAFGRKDPTLEESQTRSVILTKSSKGRLFLRHRVAVVYHYFIHIGMTVSMLRFCGPFWGRHYVGAAFRSVIHT